MQQQIQSLYSRYFGELPTRTESISGSAGGRQYLRLYNNQGDSVIGVGCPDEVEQRAFCELSACMLRQGLRVPKVLATDEHCYLQEDLGKVSLYDMIHQCQTSGQWDEGTIAVLHQVMRDLPHIQSKSLIGFDSSHCCREQSFSAQTVRWDLNYFKYCFLKGTGVAIDEIQLQEEFDRLETDLLSANTSDWKYFLYRDFQSRNILVKEGEPYYIDFQAGYQGPFYYDIASFLWQARADYPAQLRASLLDTYLTELQKIEPVDPADFHHHLEHYVFFRLLQVLGAYGFRGIVERKAAFLSPIAKALSMINEVGAEYTYIHQLLDAIKETSFGQAIFQKDSANSTPTLTVRISSFSYKKGIPDDYSGNGGGFVFDCRAPHNPGRYAEYKHLTGLDQPVIDFLEGRDNDPAHRPIGTELTMPQYMEHVYALVDPAVQTYLTRGFTHLMVSFGCTGGQHRSVYGAEHLAQHLKGKYPQVRILLTHREQNIYKEL